MKPPFINVEEKIDRFVGRRTMIGTLDVQVMLEILCERLAALLDAPYGWVVLRDAGGQPQLMACHNLTIGANG